VSVYLDTTPAENAAAQAAQVALRWRPARDGVAALLRAPVAASP
jgi:hypothetical protein